VKVSDRNDGTLLHVLYILAQQVARFKRQKSAEAKLQEIKERKERRGRSLRATALSTPVNVGEEDSLDDDGEEEHEVSCDYLFIFHILKILFFQIMKFAFFKQIHLMHF
jgi:hypothetical protein